MPNLLITITGPTAVGKTNLAIALAQHFQCEILSCDSRQFYREMSIGTAKPTVEELQAAPHHFINNLSITDNYSVGDFETEALNLLNALFKKNPIQIAVGGSGLFVKTLLQGIDYFPDTDPEIRAKITEDYNEKGLEYIQKKLQKLDPHYFQEVDINNPQRIIRALEVCIGTRQTFSSFRKNPKYSRNFTPIIIGLNDDREKLYHRINQRVDNMINNGLIEEVQSLYEYRNLITLKTVGYSEIFDYLNQQHTLEKAIELIKRNSRRYAKRQITWFGRDENTKWFTPYEQENIIRYIEESSKY